MHVVVKVLVPVPPLAIAAHGSGAQVSASDDQVVALHDRVMDPL